MIRIRLLKDWQSKKAGDIINISEKGARQFIVTGSGEYLESKATTKESKNSLSDEQLERTNFNGTREDIHNHISLVIANLLKHQKLKINNKEIFLDYKDLLIEDYSLYEELEKNPTKYIPIFEDCIKGILSANYKLVFDNCYLKKQINNIKISDIGFLVKVSGSLKRVTKVIPRISKIEFECSGCGAKITILQPKRSKTKPTICSCGNEAKFKILKEHFVDIQELNLEENPEELAGRQPKQIRVYLEGEYLTDPNFSHKLQPGKRIEVIGTIKTLPIFLSQKDQDLNITEFMIEANNLICLENEDLDLDDEDLKKIKEISVDKPLEKLAQSLVPEIYGNLEIKKAITLQLVKGSTHKRTDGSFTREDIHILLVGDPGVAKSVTIKSASAKTPGARMIVGTKSSRVGLTGMAVKDPLTETWALEAGALVQSSGSLVAIDEIDKMYKEHIFELLEPMSSGTVSINKAGISAILPARTSVLASANPVHGSFDISQPLAKQIDLPTPILNRFDLIFVMLDKPDPKFDEESIRFVLETKLTKRQMLVDPTLFKKYIFYCRSLNPELDPSVMDGLISFYTEVRKMSSTSEVKGIPINLRNMEGIIRLAEANAKLRLSNKVEICDVEVAKEIFVFCLNQIGMDSSSRVVDLSRITQKVPVSKKSKVEAILSIMNELQNKFGSAKMFSIKEKALELGVEQYMIPDIMELLMKEGKVIEPKKGEFRLL